MTNQKVLAVVMFFLSLALSVSFFVFKDFFREATSLGLLGLFIINFVSGASLFFPTPAFLTVIAGGNLYNPLIVAVISSLGATLGDMVGFVFGFSGRKIVNHKLSAKKWFIILEKHFKKHGGWITFILAVIPNPFFDALGILAGVLNYSPKRFFLIMFMGRLLRYALLAEFGAFL